MGNKTTPPTIPVVPAAETGDVCGTGADGGVQEASKVLTRRHPDPSEKYFKKPRKSLPLHSTYPRVVTNLISCLEGTKNFDLLNVRRLTSKPNHNGKANPQDHLSLWLSCCFQCARW